jgi:hypothetical protein
MTELYLRRDLMAAAAAAAAAAGLPFPKCAKQKRKRKRKTLGDKFQILGAKLSVQGRERGIVGFSREPF